MTDAGAAQRVSANTTLIFVSRCVQIGAQVLVTWLLLERLGLDRFGVLSFLLAVSGTTRQIAELGQDLALARAHLREFGSHAELLQATLLCRLAAVVALTAPLALVVARAEPTELITFLLLQLDAVVWLWASASFAYHRSNEDARPEGLAFSLAGPLMAACIWAWATTPRDYAWCSLAVSLVLLVIGWKNPWSALPDLRFTPNRAAAARILRDSLPVAISGTMGYLYARSGLFALYAIAPPAAVGAYSAAHRVLLVAGLVPGSFTLAVFPRLSALLLLEDRRLFQRQAQLAFDVMMRLGMPVALLFGLIVPDALALVLGVRAEPIIPVARAIAGCLCASFPGTLLGFAMLAGSDLASYQRFWLGALVTHAVLAAAVAAAGGGAVGVGGALLVSDLIVTSALFWIVCRERAPLVAWPGVRGGIASTLAVAVVCAAGSQAGRAGLWISAIACGLTAVLAARRALAAELPAGS